MHSTNLFQKMQTIHAHFADLLSDEGAVVLAGGSVRDTLLGTPPKDYDLFILPQTFAFPTVKANVRARLEGLAELPPVVPWHRSEPYLLHTVAWDGSEIQLLGHPAKTVESLVATFDWNVSLFAYDGDRVFEGMPLDQITPGGELALQTVSFPEATLRRGYRFSERYHMKLRKEDILTLCQQIVDKR